MRAKIYYFSPSPSDSTAFYRTSGILPWINHPEFELIDVSGRNKWDWASLTGCRMFIIQRPFASEHIQLMRLIKSLGIYLIADYDDALLEVDMHNPTYQQYLNSRDNIRECIKLANELWVSTQAIADSFGHINTHVIPNAHNDHLFPTAKKRNYNPTTKKCIYRGGSSHQADVNAVATSLIKVINDNQDWEFQFLGDRFTYLELNCGDNYHIVQGMPIMDYFGYYYEQNANIAIFPLVDTPFNRGKSNISWIEATYAGSCMYGQVVLPEFNKKGILDISDFIDFDMKTLEYHNKISWQQICDTLLLSKINQLRINRILANATS